MPELTFTEIQVLRNELSRAAIRDALFRYCRGVDRGDEEGFLSAFHPGAVEHHGRYKGPVEAFAALTVGKVRDGVLGIQHTLGNMLVEFDYDVARVETYFQATYRDKAAPEFLVCVGGRYLDRFEFRHNTWRIARRTVVNDWSLRDTISQDVNGIIGYLISQTDRSDPVFDESTWSPATGEHKDTK